MASREPSTFDNILASFQKRLSPQDLETFRITTFDDLKFAISSIQKEQAARKGLRNLNKIKPFIDGLNQYSQVLEVFVQVKPEILAFIWGPIKLCLQIASKLKEAFDILLDAYEKIGASLPIISAVDTLFRSNPYVKQILADVFEDILDFHKRAIVFFKQPTWKLCLKTTYQPFTLVFEDILKKLDRSRDLLLHSANIAHFQESQEARTLFTKEFQVLIDAEQSRRRIEVIESLSTEQNFAILHQELRDVRAMLPQTTRWIYTEPEMINWLKEKNGGFWICGSPGAGKTVIFNSIVDEINTRFPESQLVYFYCKNNDPFRSNFVDVARSLVAQIIHLSPSCLDFIYEAIHKSGELRPKNPSFFLQLLKDILQYHDSLYIGIDGLDECPEKDRQLLSDLIVAASTADSIHGNAKIFVTSRKEKDLDKSLGSIARLDIKPQNLEGDITAYICMKVSQLGQNFSFSREREESISAEICTRPKGMFLLARLIMDNLLDQDSLDDLDEELKSEILPHGINEAYERMLIRIGKSDSKRGPSEKHLRKAKFILQLIITARRELFVHEIQGALAINLEKENIDFDGRYSTLPLDELCGPIIQIHKNDRVEMIHPTAKEYLWQYHSKHYINYSTAKETMVTICASYLTFNCFYPDIQDDKLLDYVSRGEYAFQEYAVCNWLHHFKCFLQENEMNTAASSSLWMAFRILNDRHEDQAKSTSQLNLSSKMDILNMLNKLLTLYDNSSTILPEDLDLGEEMPYFLLKLFQSRLLIEDQFINAVDSECLKRLTKYYGKSPFLCPMVQCPSFVTGFTTQKDRKKHFTSHQRLFKCTHEMCDYSEIGLPSEAALKIHLSLYHEMPRQDQLFPSIKTQSLEKALHDAIVANDLVAVTALATELAAFPERETGFILQALTLQHKEAAIILLQSLGTPSEIDHVKNHTTALLKACEIGDENLVTKFLEKGGNINIDRKIMSSSKDLHPLSLAAKNGHISVIKILLGHKDLALAGSRGGYGPRGALFLASIGGFSEIVSLILEADSEFYVGFIGYIDRALTAAIRSGSVSVAELILRWAQEKDIMWRFSSKIKNLSENGVDKIIEFLTQQNREVDEKGGTRENLLQAMAHKGDVAEVSRLLDLGADIENNSGKWGTPLMAAASGGKLEAIKLLIDRGANIMTMDAGKNRSGRSAVDSAAANGREEVAKYLLSNGARFSLLSLHRRNTYGRRVYNVLQMASQRKGSAPIIKLLVEHGADVNVAGTKNDIRYPLTLAAASGDFATLQALLDHGADINGLSEETALMAAVKRKQDSEGLLITQKLIEMGANLDMVDISGNTALILAAGSYNVNLQSFRLLLESGADISIRNSEGRTALMVAAANGRDYKIQCLLECRSDAYINEVEEVGDALSLAAEYFNKKIVELLLDFSRNIDQEDGRYNTALSRALSTAKSVSTAEFLTTTQLRDQENIVNLLLEHGAVPLEGGGAAQT